MKETVLNKIWNELVNTKQTLIKIQSETLSPFEYIRLQGSINFIDDFIQNIENHAFDVEE